MQVALVTGGAGFIGTNICKLLLKKNYRVVCLDNFITSPRNNIEFLKSHENFSFMEHDIADPFPKRFFSELSSLDIIYHLACPTGVSNIVPFGEEIIRTCSEGTKNVLEIAKRYNAKLLYSSSSEIYGDPLISPQDETYTGNVDPLGERSPYEEGKRVAESLVHLYVKKYKVRARIVRIFNTYGPNMSLQDPRVIPRFIASLLKNEGLPVQGDGSQKRTFLYIDDLLDGFLLVNEKGRDGEVYNLGSDNEISIIQLAYLFMKCHAESASEWKWKGGISVSPYDSDTSHINVLDYSHIINMQASLKNLESLKITFTKRPMHDPEHRLPSLDKVSSLGWKPSVSLTEGLRRTLRWYGL